MKVVTGSSAANPNFFRGAKYFDFKRATVFCSGHCLSKHKMTRYAKNLGGIASLAPLSTPMVARKKEKERIVLSLLDVQSSTDKTLAKTQDY